MNHATRLNQEPREEIKVFNSQFKTFAKFLSELIHMKMIGCLQSQIEGHEYEVGQYALPRELRERVISLIKNWDNLSDLDRKEKYDAIWSFHNSAENAISMEAAQANKQTFKILSSVWNMTSTERNSIQIEPVFTAEAKYHEHYLVLYKQLLSYLYQKSHIGGIYNVDMNFIETPEEFVKLVENFRVDWEAVKNPEYEKALKTVTCP